MNKPQMIITPQSIALVFENGVPVVLHNGSSAYMAARTAILAKDWQRLHDLAFPAIQVTRKLEAVLGTSSVRVDSNQIFYNDEPLHNVVTDRILKLLADGFDIMPMVRFLERLMKNPSFTAIKELYLFLEASNLPIDEDGYFYAYKRITWDWKDEYTKKIDNSVGAKPEMPRGAVNDNRDHTCAEGLHFCAYGYLAHYGSSHGGRVVIVKIDPADVVSIPSDYNNQKGRCCKYEVVREVQLESRAEHAMPDERIEGVLVEDPIERAPSDDLIAQIIPLTGAVKQYFDSVKAASVATGIDTSSIARVLRGDRKSTGGYGWRYANDEDPVGPVGLVNVHINYGNTSRYEDEEDEDDDYDWDDRDDRW